MGEASEYEADPAKADTDGDGLHDGDEVNIYGSNPLNRDSDGDGVADGLDSDLTYTVTVESPLPSYNEAFTDGTGEPVYATTLHFEPGNVPEAGWRLLSSQSRSGAMRLVVLACVSLLTCSAIAFCKSAASGTKAIMRSRSGTCSRVRRSTIQAPP